MFTFLKIIDILKAMRPKDNHAYSDAYRETNTTNNNNNDDSLKDKDDKDKNDDKDEDD
ncbi:hypothetical protein CCHR01_10165 [Colletotrichum chrysophilum]|uniref:Uncharacterized protein n=1 Tax=Colletotrichum chrysophilum TaxID=1836956 RepID=A0AAD9AFJ9_9PEZI|nr:hypothetical protein CCHR01_10165 [Colletotrichum chrysophilum]